MPCRLCIAEDQILIPIYDENGVDRRGIASTITKFLGLQLPAHEYPPTQICIGCWANLDNFQKFCRLIEEKQRTLRAAAIEIEHDAPTLSTKTKHEESQKSSIADHTVEVKLEYVPDGDTSPAPEYNVPEKDTMEEEETGNNNVVEEVERARLQQSQLDRHSSQSGYTGEIDDAVSWKLLNCTSPTCSPVHVFWKIPRRSDGRVVRKRCSLCYKNLKAETGSTYIATRRAKQVDTECSSCKKTFCLKCFNRYHKKE